jgi:hypothetical protein
MALPETLREALRPLVLAFLIPLLAVRLHAHAIVIDESGPGGVPLRSGHAVRHDPKPIVGGDQERSRSNTTLVGHISDTLDTPYPSH